MLGVTVRPPAFAANGLRIGANNFQWQHSISANPTTRPDGSALVAGDRILDSFHSREWRWTGVLWVTDSFLTNAYVASLPNGTGMNVMHDIPLALNLLVVDIVYSFFSSTGFTSGAGTTIQSVLRSMGTGTTILLNQNIADGQVFAANTRYSVKQSINLLVNSATVPAIESGIGQFASNSAPALNNFSMGLRCRLVR